MTSILTIDFWNQMLKTKKEPNVKNKAKKERKKSCSCQLCGRVTSVKHLHTTEPHHRGLTCAYSHHRFEVSELKIQTFLLQRTSSVFCSESIRCEPMPLFRGETFFVVIQTTSKHWAQWSLYLPCSLSGDEAGVRLLWVRPLGGTWPVYFFLYWGWCGEWAQSKTWKQKGENMWADVVEWVSFLCLWICTICFSCMFEWELLYILMSLFVCLIVLHWPLLSFVLLPFLVFVIFLFVFLIGRFPYNCYYYYCIVTIVS